MEWAGWDLWSGGSFSAPAILGGTLIVFWIPGGKAVRLLGSLPAVGPGGSRAGPRAVWFRILSKGMMGVSLCAGTSVVGRQQKKPRFGGRGFCSICLVRVATYHPAAG
jgi:hypothetical protein